MDWEGDRWLIVLHGRSSAAGLFLSLVRGRAWKIDGAVERERERASELIGDVDEERRRIKCTTAELDET